MHWNASSVMFLRSSGASRLSTSYPLTQVTQLGWSNHSSNKPRVSHLVAFSAASVIERMAPLLAAPVTPSAARALQREWPRKPRQPTSTVWQHARQPRFLQSSTSSWYLFIFPSCASSMCSSRGMVRSHMMTGLLRLLNRSLGLWLLPAFYVCFLLGGWQANDRDVKTEIQLPCKIDFGAASLYWRNPTLTFTLGRDNTHTLCTSCVLVIKNDVSLDFNQQRPKTKTAVMVLIKTSVELVQIGEKIHCAADGSLGSSLSTTVELQSGYMEKRK